MRLFISVLLFCLASSTSAKTVYVKSSATGLNNGTSWLNAYINLTTAINSAAAGDSLKVAEGIYKPGTAGGNSFSMRSGIKVFGGYASDTTITTRNWSLYPTIVSGEIGNPSITSDNIWVILIANNADPNTEWDGFVVEKGNSSGSNGTYRGAIICVNNSRNTIRNFLVRDNYGVTNFASAITCVASTPTIINSVFSNNSGGYATVFAYQNSTPKLYNCLFSKNFGDRVGGVAAHQSTMQLINCTLFGNFANYTGRAAVEAANNSTLNVFNCVFFNNGVRRFNASTEFTLDSLDVLTLNSTTTIRNSVLQNNNDFVSGVRGLNPKFKDTANPAGPDNRFFTADDGLQLTNLCSPALNFGDNSLLPAITTDLAGNPRIFNSIIDAGAYELQLLPGTAPAVAYVNKLATGNNSGSSWSDAFTDLQLAMQGCADTIKIAAGTYYPSSTTFEISFWLRNKLVLLGGYPGTGNPTDGDRNPLTNVTTLSGTQASVKTKYIIQGRRVDSTCLLDGFTITGGNTNDANEGAPVYFANRCSPVIRNCTFTTNNGRQSGAVLNRDTSSPVFVNCFFTGNNTFSTGIVVNNFFSSPTFTGCNFSNNFKSAVYNINLSSPTFDSCQFIQNTAASGGAAYNSYSNPVFRNCRFNLNNAGIGGAVYNISASTVFDHCYFSNTITMDNAGIIYNGPGSASSFSFCEFRDANVASRGAAVFNESASGVFTSCVFYNNVAKSKGGALYNYYSNIKLVNCVGTGNSSYSGSFMHSERSLVELVNCTITKNILWGSNSVWAGILYNNDSTQLSVKNSIIWANHEGVLTSPIPEIYNSPAGGYMASATQLYNSMTHVYPAGAGNGNTIGVSPLMVDYNDPDGPDNQFFTADDGIRLSSCSPAINVGNTSFNGASVDILDSNRLVGAIDIGAYEFQTTNLPPRKKVYVNSLATGTGDGSSWQNAYTNLWPAITDICVDTIRVAAGTYKPALLSRDSAFLLRYGKVFLGGYPAAGTPTDAERDANTHATILSGNIGNLADSLDNSLNVIKVSNADGETVLDGFTIIGGVANKVGTSTNGGGVLVLNSPVTLSNLQIRGNVALYDGGGIYCISSPKFKISRCVITNNRSMWDGGGMWIGPPNAGQTILVERSVFSRNNASGFGAGIYNVSGNIQIQNAVFYANRGASGAGIYNESAGGATITNCSFVNNNSYIGNARGAGIYNTQGQNPITNCVFSRNTNHLGVEEYIVGGDMWDGNCQNYEGCLNGNVRNCRIQTFRGSGCTGLKPLFIDTADADGKDNMWMTDDDGLQLAATSPLVNFGLATAVAAIPFDILGNRRVIGIKPDVGAYESSGPACRTQSFISTETGDSYQWQVDTGSGFMNITDDAIYTGTNTATLNLTQAPTSWYAYRYRCIVTTGNTVKQSKEYILKFVSVWTGAVSTAWDNPLNWSCSEVPDAYTDVLVYNNAPFSLVININAICRSIRVQEGATVTLGAGFTLTTTH